MDDQMGRVDRPAGSMGSSADAEDTFSLDDTGASAESMMGSPKGGGTNPDAADMGPGRYGGDETTEGATFLLDGLTADTGGANADADLGSDAMAMDGGGSGEVH